MASNVWITRDIRSGGPRDFRVPVFATSRVTGEKPMTLSSPTWCLRYATGLAILWLCIGTAVRAGELDCGVLQNWQDFGPYDYRDPFNLVPTGADPMGRLKRVENSHFQPELKAFTITGIRLKQASVEHVTANFAYTLRVFPNHPEALHLMSRLERLAGGKLPQVGITPFTPRISADCFFDRALRFRPEDAQVHYMLAIHLHDRGRLGQAKESFLMAEGLGLSTPNFLYNFGLLLTDLKEWEAARDYARKAYAGGYALDGLRRRLTAAGYVP